MIDSFTPQVSRPLPPSPASASSGGTIIRRVGATLPERVGRVVLLTATGVLLLICVYTASILLTDHARFEHPGTDLGIYLDATRRFLGGGPFYLPEQIAGPYVTLTGHVMYPPVAMLWFAPFLVLPAVLWWAIPAAVIGWTLIRLRPAMWAWPLMAACIGWPYSVELVWTGNPLLWIVGAMALATRYPAASVLIFAKPSLFPFAFWGVRNRSWWLALAAAAAVSILFAPLWLDWLRVVLNARGPFSGLLYSVKDLPLMLLPLFAWAGRTISRPASRA